MQVDILGVRIVFGFLTVAMLILVHGLLFNYNLIIPVSYTHLTLPTTPYV